MFPQLYERQSRLIKYFHVNSLEPLQIRIQLHVFDVPINAESPSAKYAALSYTWEGPAVSVDIYDECGTLHQVTITQSLANGLIQLYQKFSARELPELWADQLCIDQRNVRDKVRQIPLMEHIFQYAVRVHIWLGELDPRNEIAMRAIEMLSHDLQNLTGPQPGQALVTDMKFRARALLCNLGLGKLPAATVWSLISQFCRKRWFSRAWVLQEATVPDQPVDVHCGTYSITFDAVVRVWHAVNNLFPLEDAQVDPFLKEINDSGLRTLNILSYIRNPRNAPRTTLLDLRRISLGSQATDPRDKIYSIMSMASDWQSSSYDLTVDYDAPLKQTYTSFAIWHMLEHGNLDFLGESRPIDHYSRNLPCWVPDWSETNENKDWISLARRSVASHAPGIPIYNAGQPLERSILRYEQKDTIPEALTLKGVYIGSVRPLPQNSHHMVSLGRSGFWQRRSHLCQGLTYKQIAERTYAADTYQDNDTNSTFYQYKRGAYFALPTSKDHQSGIVGPPSGLFRTSKHKMSRKHLFMCDGQSLGLGDEKIIGSGPDTMQHGDQLWMLHGGQVLYILRPFQWPGGSVEHFNATGESSLNTPRITPAHNSTRNPQPFDFVGDAFALGLMNGELGQDGRFQYARREIVCLISPPKDSNMTDVIPLPTRNSHAERMLVDEVPMGRNPHLQFPQKVSTMHSIMAQSQQMSPFGRSDTRYNQNQLSPELMMAQQRSTPFGRLNVDQSDTWRARAETYQDRAMFARTTPGSNFSNNGQQQSPFGGPRPSPFIDRYTAFSNIGTTFGR